ncbi:hypothetical protein D9M68_159040 [compost metagenome]
MRVIVFDTETTGTDHQADQIIEAAWLELPDNPADFIACASDQLPHYHERFRPSVPINLGAQATHHILCEDLVGCRNADQFQLPADVDLLIGHNVDFDHRFAGEPDIARICTLALSRFLFADKDSHTQSAMLYLMARRAGREGDMRERLRNAHAALDDVRNCAILLKFLIQQAAKACHDVSTWEAVHELSELARIPTVMGFGKHKGTAIKEIDAGYVRWYRGQAETDPYYLEAFKRAGF